MSGVRVGAFALALLGLLSFSFLWVWSVGHRGLFMLDQSIVFDGAWRIVQGQVPYRDFVMPFGPVTFALCALMFRLRGVDFSSLVLTAALMSALATALAVRLSWLLTGGSRWLALLGGLMTAVWFQAPFGTPWMEQTGFLMDLIALACIVEGRLHHRREGPRGSLADSSLPAGWLGYGFAGIASVAAVLSKQNAGGLFVFLCLGALLAPGDDRPRAGIRAVCCYVLGGALALGAFVAWLALRSDIATFKHYWVDVSAEIGASRVAYWKLLGTIVFQPLLGSSIPLFMLSSLAGLATAGLSLASARSPGRLAQGHVCTSIAQSAWLAVALPQFHSAFQLTTNNDASNNNAFVGLTAVCLAALVGHWLTSAPSLSYNDGSERVRVRLVRPALVKAGALLVGGLVLYSIGEGLMIAQGRYVQEFAPGTTFTERLRVPRASRVLWGEPTRITPQFCSGLGDMCKISSASTALDHSYEILQRDDFERVASLLEQRHRNFFVFPDATMLYGLTGRPSPQPLLYFHPGQSYALADQAELDHRIVDALEQHQVDNVVLERASFMGTHKLLVEFPRLDAWIARNFELSAEIGNYHVFSRPVLSAAR
jgi:hypothetical protein